MAEIDDTELVYLLKLLKIKITGATVPKIATEDNSRLEAIGL